MSKGPGVTEIVTPQTTAKGIRSFTNLMEGGASPQQVAGFEENSRQGNGRASFIPAEQANAEARMAMGLGEGRRFTANSGDGIYGVASPAPLESRAAQAAMRQLKTEQNPFTAGRLREIIKEDQDSRSPIKTTADLERMAAQSLGGKITARNILGIRKRAADIEATQQPVGDEARSDYYRAQAEALRNPPREEVKPVKIGSYSDEMGNMVDQYGVFDPQSRSFVPINAGQGPSQVESGLSQDVQDFLGSIPEEQRQSALERLRERRPELFQ
jgi:hypothetical protein